MSNQLLRDYGLCVGHMETGEHNHISDVPGVSVGHVTLSHAVNPALPVDACTGVTAIMPHRGDIFMDKCVAAAEVINGFGKTTGVVQLQELGQLETPIMLTNTFGVPAVSEGTLRSLLRQNDQIGDTLGSLNVVVGECNDSYLNDMRGLHITSEDAKAAIEVARRGSLLAQGAIGAGTGMRCFGWKGGIGSASRRMVLDGHLYHIGILVQSNYGQSEDLTILGAPVGRYFRPQGHLPPLRDEVEGTETGWTEGQRTEPENEANADQRPLDGSIMIILATDLPLDALQLKRLAKRCVVGLARTGSVIHNGSGDIVIAFSNGNRVAHTETAGTQSNSVLYLSGSLMSRAFIAVAEATEEAVLNSLFAATTTRGRQNRVVPALPRDEVAEFVKEWTHHRSSPRI